MNCHRVINPLGFSLENYDAVGRFRTIEKDKPVNAAGIYSTPDGTEIRLNGAKDLAQFLAQDEYAQKNFIRQLFRYYAKQPISAYGPERLEQLYTHFVQSNYNIIELITEIAWTIVQHDPTTETTK